MRRLLPLLVMLSALFAPAAALADAPSLTAPADGAGVLAGGRIALAFTAPAGQQGTVVVSRSPALDAQGALAGDVAAASVRDTATPGTYAESVALGTGATPIPAGTTLYWQAWYGSCTPHACPNHSTVRTIAVVAPTLAPANGAHVPGARSFAFTATAPAGAQLTLELWPAGADAATGPLLRTIPMNETSPGSYSAPLEDAYVTVAGGTLRWSVAWLGRFRTVPQDVTFDPAPEAPQPGHVVKAAHASGIHLSRSTAVLHPGSAVSVVLSLAVHATCSIARRVIAETDPLADAQYVRPKQPQAVHATLRMLAPASGCAADERIGSNEAPVGAVLSVANVRLAIPLAFQRGRHHVHRQWRVTVGGVVAASGWYTLDVTPRGPHAAAARISLH